MKNIPFLKTFDTRPGSQPWPRGDPNVLSPYRPRVYFKSLENPINVLKILEKHPLNPFNIPKSNLNPSKIPIKIIKS